MEAEGQQLVAELDRVITDIGELHEQWDDTLLSPELRHTGSRSYDIDLRTRQFMSRQIHVEINELQEPEVQERLLMSSQINVDLFRRLELLEQRQLLFIDARLGAHWTPERATEEARWAAELIEQWEAERATEEAEEARWEAEEARWAEEAEEARMGARMPREIIPIWISSDHIRDNNSITSTCPICHDDFLLGEEAGQLDCHHIFHPHCISQWLRSNNTCPICRRT